MKFYEQTSSSQFFKMIPVIARLDGRAFHTFTKGLDRPYDKRLSDLMIKTTKMLVKATNARCGHTQSDEISLVWLAEEWESDIFFSGKLQKMNSLLASMASTYFNLMLPNFLPEKAEKIQNWVALEEGESPIPQFDSRVFQVPTDFEACNCFIWREQDATRNSVQMAARAYYSHNECHLKDCSQLQEMLFQAGVNWNNYPGFFKRGTYVRRRVLEMAFTADELAVLPEKHAARRDPDLKIRRTVVMEEDFPPLAKIANREEVILYGKEPVLRADNNDTVE